MPRAHHIGKHVRRRGPAGDACAEERLAPAASAARAEVAQKGQASLVRVEVAQENRDEEITEASVTSDAGNVKPRIEESREDSDRSDQSNGGR